jgi:lipopolysaccharide transport system ATP-binding protein
MVSHSLETIQGMCTRAIWIDHGQVRAEGPADTVVRQYQGFDIAAEALRLTEQTAPDLGGRWGNRTVEIERVRLTDDVGVERVIFHTGEPLVLHLHYQAHKRTPSPIFGMAIHRQDGAHITGPNTQFAGLTLPTLDGRGVVSYAIPALPLLEGLYHVSVAVVNSDDSEMFDYHDRAYSFRVVNLAGEVRERYGLITMQGQWRHEPAP